MTQMTDSRFEDLKATLQEGIDSITTGADWKRYLDFQATFPRYSFNNLMLVFVQRPDATLVMGKGDPAKPSKRTTWATLGRTARDDAQKIWIWAPYSKKYEDAKGEEKSSTRFMRVPVIDVADTEGDELPDAPVSLLKGTDAAGLLGPVAEFIRSQGFTVEFVPSIPGSEANGDMNPTSKVIRVCTGGRDERQQAKTAIHEAAHLILHSSGKGVSVPRSQKEIEAESVAYIVSAHLGVDTGDYSFGYVASWSDDTGFTARTAIKHSGKRIQTAANQILRAVDPAETLAASQELAA